MSGRKNVILPHKIVDAQPLSASFKSVPINVQYLDNIGLMLKVTTTANTGVFEIEASIDGVTYDVLTLTPAISPLAGVNDIITINLNQVPFSYIRISFTLGTGTNGSVDAFLTAKEL